MTVSLLVIWTTVACCYMLRVSAGQGNYNTFYLEDSCYKGQVLFSLDPEGSSSAAILQATKSTAYSPGLQCTALLSAPPQHGIVLSIQMLDLDPNCLDYLKIHTRGKADVTLCGSQNYPRGEKVYTSEPDRGFMLVFHTIQAKGKGNHTGFQLTFTAYKQDRNDSCSESGSFRCDNTRCIWDGLTCDRHNNCGDNSDEAEFPRQCRTGVIYFLIVYVVPSVLLVVLIGSICYCCRRFWPPTRETVYVRLYPPHSKSSPYYGSAAPTSPYNHTTYVNASPQ